MSQDIYTEFINYTRTINDPRQPIKRTYPLDEILFLGLCSTLSGCEGWDEMSFFGEEHIDFLRNYLPYENGIPSTSTIFRVISMLPCDDFEEFFTSWFNNFKCSGHISIDGKAIRGSKKGGKSPVHILHACDSQSGILLGYKTVSDKTNEIPVAAQLIEELNINDCTVTLDAMGCQRNTCSTIVNNGGNYVINLKGNQGNLHSDIKLLFDEKEYLDIKTSSSVDKGHGRIEERKIYATEDVGYLIEQHKWPHLKTVIMCEYSRIDKKTKPEILYYITSHEANTKMLQDAIRSHWKVESSHWILDVTFNEDKSAISADNAAENMAFIRRVALNMIKIYQKNLEKNMSVKRIQKKCLVRPDTIKSILSAKINST